MNPTDFCYYIDTKGKAHKAQVVSSRPNKIVQTAMIGNILDVAPQAILLNGMVPKSIEGDSLMVVAAGGYVRGAFIVREASENEDLKGTSVLEADNLPAGTIKGDFIHHAVVVSDEPILSLSYVSPVTQKTETISELMHISHPAKQETNPALPTIHLHAWKRLDEGHTAPRADHPVFDHPHDHGQVDEFGKPVVKSRPLHEAHIAEHQANLPEETRGQIASEGQKQKELSAEHRATLPAFRLPQNAANLPAEIPGVKAKAPVSAEPEEHHPGNPNTLHFPFECQTCGKLVRRTASHHGGKQFEPKPGAQETGAVLGEDNSHLWVAHVCKNEDIQLYHVAKMIERNPPKAAVELTPSERLAAGEQLSPEVKSAVEAAEEEVEEETDVIDELQKAPPAPSETENKPEDAA